jgi:putative peptidoglycan lipid II flippase
MIANLAPDIVRLFFERGAFSAESTRYTASAWAIYSIALYLALCGTIMARVYNALQDARDQVIASLIGLAVHIGGNLMFMRFYGHNGIALSAVISTAVTTALLYMLLRRRLGPILSPETAGTLMKTVLANALLFAFAWAIRGLYVPQGGIWLLLWLAAVAAACAGFAVLAYRLLRIGPGVRQGGDQSERTGVNH